MFQIDSVKLDNQKSVLIFGQNLVGQNPVEQNSVIDQISAFMLYFSHFSV